MTDFNADRRQVLVGAALVGVLTAAPLASAQPVARAAPNFTPQALSFDPKTVAGLSEKLLVSHHDNNYVGAVKRLGAIEAQLAGLDPSAAPTFLLNGLKEEAAAQAASLLVVELIALAGTAYWPVYALHAQSRSELVASAGRACVYLISLLPSIKILEGHVPGPDTAAGLIALVQGFMVLDGASVKIKK